MKKTMFVLALAIVIVAMSTTAAFAAYKVDVVDYDQAVIHGGYGAATTACKACHDVHGGQEGSDGTPLFRWASAQAGCNACHTTGSALTTHVVYETAGTIVAEHSIGASAVYDATDNADLMRDTVANLGCLDCHDAGPHAAGEATTFFNGDADGGALILASWGSVTGYCAGCHDLNDDALTSHPLDGTADGVRAFVASDDCTDCHDSTAGSGFPHDGANYAFLGADGGTTADVYPDAVCIACHINGTATVGVGITY